MRVPSCQEKCHRSSSIFGKAARSGSGTEDEKAQGGIDKNGRGFETGSVKTDDLQNTGIYD